MFFFCYSVIENLLGSNILLQPLVLYYFRTTDICMNNLKWGPDLVIAIDTTRHKWHCFRLSIYWIIVQKPFQWSLQYWIKLHLSQIMKKYSRSKRTKDSSRYLYKRSECYITPATMFRYNICSEYVYACNRLQMRMKG